MLKYRFGGGGESAQRSTWLGGGTACPVLERHDNESGRALSLMQGSKHYLPKQSSRQANTSSASRILSRDTSPNCDDMNPPASRWSSAAKHRFMPENSSTKPSEGDSGLARKENQDAALLMDMLMEANLEPVQVSPLSPSSYRTVLSLTFYEIFSLAHREPKYYVVC